MSEGVRVLLVDDQPAFREAAAMVIDMTDGFVLVGEATRGDEAVTMAVQLDVDLVLVDLQMPGIDGIETTRRLRALPDPPRVLVLSTREAEDFEGPSRAAGALGFVTKSAFGLDTLPSIWPAG